MLERGKMDRDLVEFVVIDQLVPKEHLLRKIDAAVDFTQLYEMVEPLYCEDNGRPSIDPVVLFKMVLIQHLHGLPSLRRTAEEVSANNCYRWFLGYPLQEETPHFSTVSYRSASVPMIITVQRNEWHASQKIAEKIELLVTNRHCQEMNIVRAHFWRRWSLGQHPPQTHCHVS